ncbi:hypothetical protein CVU82_01690 [Candidatus Falkowbacteria bacterium HGW-Falkowbacteria-1]|jgi:hypothetical protein|uniref:Xylose isomerase-like TIM barrel domain-containing protein n=1 Tax=Candidatus Falkowbacteria bacterium HGW-Falkowbacteria-1 TaxID=2013768 RepID=A0A2N2E9E1_9BACT|nr:MAG: hypothetical protein CVU82_01690 [Candidatus Falkowbacteria bacterium HGW-Falkowbacteria-1]
MTIGFSDGVLHNLFNQESDRHKAGYLKYINFNAVELHCINESLMDEMINNLDNKLYSEFLYISLHAPAFSWNNDKNISLLKKIRLIFVKFNIKNVVIHPDEIKDWSIFEKFKDLPLSLENMDRDKKAYKNIKSLKEIINKYGFMLTLDLNHCYDNDETMILAEDFQDEFKDKIVEYHISGYDKEKKHTTLFDKSEQIRIINSIKFKNIPIIIESCFNKAYDVKKEYKYIEDCLRTRLT